MVGLFAALLLALGQISMGGVVTASAHDDCKQATSADNTNGSPSACGYTQLDNTWPASGASPFCGSSCVYWWMPNGGPGNVDADFTGQYPGVSGVNFYQDLLSAMHAWAGQPYNSPWMYQCGGSNCQYSQVHVGSKDEGYDSRFVTCALTYVSNDPNNFQITSSTIMWNNDSQLRWSDGPSGSACDAKAISYHEEGHVFSLGHSSTQGNAMYWQGGAEAIGGNDQTGLNAIYGPYTGGNGSGSSGGGGCPNCQTICGASEDPCNPGPGTPNVNIEGYLTKAWDMSQGASLPNPVSELTGADGCLQYFFAKQYTPWLNCQIGIAAP
ncbi:MAG TPA: hypothetical protein VN193_11915 [Candidatus Angelobacter sp.]|nr:hypothetical protein [Candidatus Angelobacter sp.]